MTKKIKITVDGTYTVAEQIVYYFKRFMKVAIPLLVVLLPVAAQAQLNFKTAGLMALVPILTTLDKFCRDKGFYSY